MEQTAHLHRRVEDVCVCGRTARRQIIYGLGPVLVARSRLAALIEYAPAWTRSTSSIRRIMRRRSRQQYHLERLLAVLLLSYPGLICIHISPPVLASGRSNWRQTCRTLTLLAAHSQRNAPRLWLQACERAVFNMAKHVQKWFLRPARYFVSMGRRCQSSESMLRQ